MGQRDTSASGRSHAVGHRAQGDADLRRVSCALCSQGTPSQMVRPIHRTWVPAGGLLAAHLVVALRPMGCRLEVA